MKEQTREAIGLLSRGAARFGGVLRQHFKAKTAPDCETGSVVEKEVSRRGLASLDSRVERIASQLARVEKNADRGGRALTNALDDFEREYNALSRGAKRYCRRSDAWIASQRKFTAFALGYLRCLASAPQGGKRATEAPAKAESPRPEAKPQTAPQKPAAKVPEGSRELPTAEDCRDRGTEAFKGKYAVVQAIACCVHAAARDHGVKPSEFRITRARGSHLSLTVRMVRTGRAMRFTGTTTPKGYRSACASVAAFFSSLAKAAKKDETPTVKPNYPKTRTVQTALASHGLRAESTMPADLLALEYSAYTMTSADQDRIADEHRAMVERLLKKGVEIDPRVAAHYNLAHVEHAPVVPSEPTLTTEQLSELTEDQRAELARLETMPLDDAQTEYQRIAKAARFVGGGIDAVFRGKHRFAIVENKREIQEMKGRNEDLPEDKRLTAYKGTAHDGTKIAVDYWIIAPKSVPKAEAEKVLGDYLDVLDAAGHQGRNDIVSLWTKTMRALGYSDALIRMNHLKDAAKRILSKRRAEASKEATTDVKWVRVDSEQNVVRLKFGRKPAAGSEKALQAAGYGLVSRGHENPYWRATWNQKARDAALAVGANAADLPEIAAPKAAEKPAVDAIQRAEEAYQAYMSPTYAHETKASRKAEFEKAFRGLSDEEFAEFFKRFPGLKGSDIISGVRKPAEKPVEAPAPAEKPAGTPMLTEEEPPHYALKAAWDGFDRDNTVWVGLWPSRASAEALAVNGGIPAKDLHMGIFYLGKTKHISNENLERLSREMSEMFEGVSPIKAKTKHLTTIYGSQVVLFDSLGTKLKQLHDAIGNAAITAGLDPTSEQGIGFVPQIALRRASSKGEPTKSIPVNDIVLNEIHLVADGEHEVYRLDGASLDSKAESVVDVLSKPEGVTVSELMGASGRSHEVVESLLRVYSDVEFEGPGILTYFERLPVPSGNEDLFRVLGVSDNGVNEKAAKAIRGILNKLGLPQFDVKVTDAGSSAPAPAPPKVEAAPVAEPPKPDANLETMARMVAELFVLPEGATTGEISAAGGGTPAAVYKALKGLGVPIIGGTQVNPGASGRDVGHENVWQVRGVSDDGVSAKGARNIRIVLAALGLPPVDVRVTNEETKPAPKPEALAVPPTPAEIVPVPQPVKPAKDPALQWHKPVGSPCSVCGVSEPRLKALHRMLSPEEQDRTGCKYLKSVKVSFGGDSEETCIGERVPRTAAAKRLSAVLLQPSGFTRKDIYGSDSTNLGAESLRAAMENLRRDGVLVRDYSSNAPRRTGYETREELEKLTAEMSKEQDSTWHVVGVSEQGVTADGAANVLKTIRALGLPDVEVTATIAAIQQPAPTDTTDEAVRRAAEQVARELGFELEPEAPAAAPVVAPTPEPPAPPVESPEEKRARELAERFAKGLSGRMGGKTISPPSASEPPAAPAPREMSAQEKANAEMAAFLEEWGN